MSKLKHVGMLALVVLAVGGAISLRGCTKAQNRQCTEVSYLPGRCG